MVAPNNTLQNQRPGIQVTLVLMRPLAAEALVAEADEEAVMEALKRHGFRESTSYRSTLRALSGVARSRRL